MGAVVGVVVGAVVGAVVSFTRRPRAPPPTDVPARTGKTREQLFREARTKLGIDTDRYNVVICGPVSVGKSTLINFARVWFAQQLGLPAPTDAAAVGPQRVTVDTRRYDVPGTFLTLWDVAGSGTTEEPSDSYFQDKCLYAFDAILMLHRDAITEEMPLIVAGARDFKKAHAFVYTKADVTVQDLMDDFDLSENDAEARLRVIAAEELRRVIDTDIRRADACDSLSTDFSARFVISTRDAKRGVKTRDEEELLRFIQRTVDARSGPAPPAAAGGAAAGAGGDARRAMPVA